MDDLIKRFTSREFILIVLFILVIVALSFVSPEKIDKTTIKIGQVTERVPNLIISLKELFKALNLPIVAGLIYAYIKRRSDQKVTEENNSTAIVTERIKLAATRQKNGTT